MEDKSFDMETYAVMMLLSNSGGNILNPDDRYLYVNTFESHRKNICEILDITSRTLTARIKKILNYTSNMIIQKVVNKGTDMETLVYKLKYKDKNNRKYMIINSVVLEELLKQKKKHLVKIYLLMCYICKDKYGNLIERKMDYKWIVNKIELKDQEWIDKCISILEALGYIEVNRTYSVKTFKNKSGLWRKAPIITHSYKLISERNISGLS